MNCGLVYRYGFNGMERDDEVKGGGKHISFNDFGLDTRLGRRWNNDPVFNPSISSYAVFNNNPNFYVDPDGHSPISIFAKAVLKQGIKKAASEFVEAQIKKRLTAYMSKSWAKQFLKDADNIMETLDTEWWEYAIEFIPVVGDAYGGYSLGKKGMALWKKMDALQKKVEAKATWFEGLVGKWGQKGADLIDAQIANRGKLRGSLEVAGKKLEGSWQAHHIIPIEALNKSEVVQAAVQAGFDINSTTNGMALSTEKHSGNHKKYNAFILNELDDYYEKHRDNLDPKAAKEFLETKLIPKAQEYIKSKSGKID